MPTDATINLDRFRCVDEFDPGAGHAEPYVWTILLWVDDTSFASGQIGSLAPTPPDGAREIVKDGILAGDVVPMRTTQQTFTHRFEDGLSIRWIGILVGFFDWDSTPQDAVRAGYSAFVKELPLAVWEFISTHLRAPETPEEREVIAAAVRSKVVEAAKGALSDWEKVQIFLGNLKLDDEFGFDSFFLDIGTIQQPANFFRLSIEKHLAIHTPYIDIEGDNHYEVDGRLVVLPTPGPDPCQAQVDAVNEAKEGVVVWLVLLLQLQGSLLSSTPSERPAILIEIRRIQGLEIPAAQVVLEAARDALSFCRGDPAKL